MSRLVLCRAVSCALALAIQGYSPVARACGNGVEVEIDPRVVALQNAESALRAGHLVAAARFVRQVDPNLRSAAHEKGMRSRAMRVMALVIVRSGGKWLVGSELGAKSEADRTANVEWAVRVLRERVMHVLNHPERLADLGEALASVAQYQDEGRRILEYLADRDLMTSAYGWAALARLRSTGGDAPAGDRALAKCRQRTKVAGVCQIHAVPSS